MFKNHIISGIKTNIGCFIFNITTSRASSDYAHGQDGIELLSKNFYM